MGEGNSPHLQTQKLIYKLKSTMQFLQINSSKSKLHKREKNKKKKKKERKREGRRKGRGNYKTLRANPSPQMQARKGSSLCGSIEIGPQAK